MLTVFHNQFEIEITSFINQQGNTGYVLDVFDYSHSGAFFCRLVRYQYCGGSKYFLVADCNGWVNFLPVSVSYLLDGFSWRHVRRAIKDQERFRRVWFSTLLF